jgi:hypothetical protein
MADRITDPTGGGLGPSTDMPERPDAARAETLAAELWWSSPLIARTPRNLLLLTACRSEQGILRMQCCPRMIAGRA